MAELFGPSTPENQPVNEADDTPETEEVVNEEPKKAPVKKAAPRKSETKHEDPNDARAEFVDHPPNDNHPESLKG